MRYLKSPPVPFLWHLKRKLCFTSILQQIHYIFCQNFHGRSSGRKQKLKGLTPAVRGIIVIVLQDSKRTPKHSDSANSHSQRPGNTARDGEEQPARAHCEKKSSPVALEKAQRFSFPRNGCWLGRVTGSVQRQPEVLGAGSREKQIRRVIKHSYLRSDVKQRPASHNPFPGSVS